MLREGFTSRERSRLPPRLAVIESATLSRVTIPGQFPLPLQHQFHGKSLQSESALFRQCAYYLPPEPVNGARTAVSAIQTSSTNSVENRVILVRRSIAPDPNDPRKKIERYVFNVYCLENGKIVENWRSISS